MDNNYNNYNNSSKKKSIIIYIIIGIIIIICIIIIIYKLLSGLNSKYHNKKKSPILIPYNINAYKLLDNKIIYKPPDINIGRFSISMWIYIENWKYNIGNRKLIINNDGDNLVYLDKYKNDLIFKLNQFKSNSNDPDPRELKLENIPIQKWVNIILILKDRTVEMYKDGRLEKAYLLEYVPKPIKKLEVLPNNNIQLQGFYGQISKLLYKNKALNYSEVQEIFQNGPH